WFVLRTFYRYYFDTFGIDSHTFSFELPIKPTRFLTFYPFYRFHFQTASTFFEPFLQHNQDDRFYTSDYDLSGFTAHKYGLGLTYSPPEGIVSLRNIPFRNRTSAFDALFLRYARYYRSDELNAFIISSGVRFSF
ncbi:MAG: DUF3570 domain-containing protein, partial [Prolixibacteraceae bacterium]|nr:DUF3570 domain-containing protein [Prolixibacteraceae bacterium]